MSHARQAIDDGIGLVHDKVEKVGKGIGAGQYIFFFFGGGGFGGPWSGKSAPLYKEVWFSFHLPEEDFDIELESRERAGGSCLFHIVAFL